MSNNFLVSIVILLIAMAGCEPTEMPGGSGSNIRQASVKKAIAIVDAALTGENAVMRTNAIEIVSAGKRMELMPKVQKLLRNDVVAVRFVAALAVGDLKYSPAKNDLSQLLNDNNVNVRIAAAYAMSWLGDAKYDKIIYAAANSKDQTVRANAAMLLGKLGSKKALPVLYKMVSATDSADKTRFQAVEAIAMLGDEEIYPKLWITLISAYADDRMMGIHAMGALGTAKAENALITMLDDDVPEVRLAAAEQLGRLGNTAGEPEVLDMLNEKATAGLEKEDIERINILASLAIGRIGTDRLTRYLPQFLEDNSPVVRLAAAKAVFIATDNSN